jgi:hypothetical protein
MIPQESILLVRPLESSKVIIVVLTNLDDSVRVRRSRDSDEVSLVSKVKIEPLGNSIITKVSGEEESVDGRAIGKIEVVHLVHACIIPELGEKVKGFVGIFLFDVNFFVLEPEILYQMIETLSRALFVKVDRINVLLRVERHEDQPNRVLFFLHACIIPHSGENARGKQKKEFA